MKRLLDIVLAALGLVLTAPLLLLAMLVIRLETPGSSIFAQPRVGLREKRFTCFKLRTMWVGTASMPTHLVHHSMVTTFGSFLRKWKIDELPQLVNVLLGDLSLVGPRPCLESQVALIEARRSLSVFAVRPGMTGLAQVRGIDMSDPLYLAKVDEEYVRTSSFIRDFYLIGATFFCVLRCNVIKPTAMESRPQLGSSPVFDP